MKTQQLIVSTPERERYGSTRAAEGGNSEELLRVLEKLVVNYTSFHFFSVFVSRERVHLDSVGG